jgi:DNA-binding winged helix-turn-helix (wHTH) protein
MMRHHGQLVTRAMLFREVWNYNFVPQSNLVDVHMGRLRRKIDQSAESPMIYSFRGQGFTFRAAYLNAFAKRASALVCAHALVITSDAADLAAKHPIRPGGVH